MASIAEANSFFEIDMELDTLLEEIELQTEAEGEPSEELTARFQQFCEARGEKVDRIGRFVRMMEAREQFRRSEAARLCNRARAAANRIERTKNMVLYYLLSRGLKKIEGQQFTLRAQKNSQNSVRITDGRRCRSATAGLRRGSPASWGRQCSLYCQTISQRLWKPPYRRSGPTRRSSRQQWPRTKLCLVPRCGGGSFKGGVKQACVRESR
jgi:hypothetical protein